MFISSDKGFGEAQPARGDDNPSSSYSAQLVLGKLEGISSDIRKINNNISELRESIDFCHAQYTDVKSKLDVVVEKQSQLEDKVGDIDALRQEKITAESKTIAVRSQPIPDAIT